MKTTFTEEEVRSFLMKKTREIQGDAILLPTNQSEEMRIVPNTFPEMLQKMYESGIKQGLVEGQMHIMKELLDFFELAADE